MLKVSQTPSGNFYIEGTLNGVSYNEGVEDEVTGILYVILLEANALIPLDDE